MNSTLFHDAGTDDCFNSTKHTVRLPRSPRYDMDTSETSLFIGPFVFDQIFRLRMHVGYDKNRCMRICRSHGTL